MSVEDHEAVKITSVFLVSTTDWSPLKVLTTPPTVVPSLSFLSPFPTGIWGAFLDVFCPKLPTTCSQRGAPSPTSQRIYTWFSPLHPAPSPSCPHSGVYRRHALTVNLGKQPFLICFRRGYSPHSGIILRSRARVCAGSVRYWARACLPFLQVLGLAGAGGRGQEARLSTGRIIGASPVLAISNHSLSSVSLSLKTQSTCGNCHF